MPYGTEGINICFFFLFRFNKFAHLKYILKLKRGQWKKLLDLKSEISLTSKDSFSLSTGKKSLFRGDKFLSSLIRILKNK